MQSVSRRGRNRIRKLIGRRRWISDKQIRIISKINSQGGLKNPVILDMQFAIFLRPAPTSMIIAEQTIPKTAGVVP